MQEFNIISVLSKYSGEIIVSVVASCIISFVLKKICKFSNKIFIILSFFIGATIYLILSAFLLNSPLLLRLTNAMTCGGLSLTVALCVKRFAFLGGDDIKKLLEKLLSTIVLSEQLDEVVDRILEKLASYGEQTKDSLKEILRENLRATLSEEELENVIAFIISACGLSSDDNNSDSDDGKDNSENE